MKYLTLKTTRRIQMLDVTAEVQRAVSESGITDGLCVVFCPHTTAGITINENADPDVVRDIEVNLAKLVPEHGDYRHSEGNSDAHIKSSLVGASETVIVEGGRLLLGTWQGIYFCEFDGPRTRKTAVKVQGKGAL